MSQTNILIKDVFYLHNEIRSDPKSFIPLLESHLVNYNDLIYKRPDPDGYTEIETYEGKSAVIEAIQFLKTQKPLKTLILNKNLCTVAHNHSADLGKNGLYESKGSDGRFPDERIKDYLGYTDNIGESIDFNSHTAQDIIYSCLVDDGISDRSRRNNMFSSNYSYIGIGINNHCDFGNCIVMDYVGGDVLQDYEIVDTEGDGIFNNLNLKTKLIFGFN